MAVGFLVLLTVLVLVGTGLAKRQSGAPASSPGATVSSDWARSMIQKYPYEPGSYSGILPARNPDEIWIIGKKTSSSLYPSSIYIGVTNAAGQYFVKISSDVEYSTQVGDEFLGSNPGPIQASAILQGDNVATRTTFVNNFPSALEVRRLTREPQTDSQFDSL